MDHQIKSLLHTLPGNCRERSNRSGYLLFFYCFAAWAISFAVMLFSPIWLSVMGSIAHGISIAMLFIVGHDAAHGSLFTSYRKNRILGTLAFLPALHPVSSWKRSHHGMHHAWTNLKGEDPGYPPFSFDEFRRLPPWRKLAERCYRTSAGLGLFYFVEIYCKALMFPSQNRRPVNPREFLFDRLIVATFLIAECLVVAWAAIMMGRSFPGLFTVYALLVPYGVFSWLMGFVTYVHHTNPQIPWFDKRSEWSFFQSQVAGTTHLHFPRILDFMFLNILQHSAHHVDPLIPLYHLPESQSSLELAYPGEIKTLSCDPRIFWNTLCCCKLYDYREHCWLNFKGVPTTPSLMAMKVSPRGVIVPAPVDDAVECLSEFQIAEI